jgi:mutator protein MutT
MDDARQRKNIVVGVLQNAAGRVLIIKRTTTEDAQGGQKLTWVFPGGHVENGDPKAELVKEFKEETGYQVEILEQLSERDYTKPYVHLTYYRCALVSSTTTVIENTEEVDRIKWVEPGLLTKFFTTDLDPKVAQYLGI